MLEILKSFWKPIAGLLAGLLVLFQRWRIKRKDAVIDQQGQVIRGHEAKERVHGKDQEIDQDADNKIQSIRRIVNHAKNQEEAAREVSKSLDGYFTGDDK